MKTQELKTLKNGDDINHKRYGICTIEDIKYSFNSFFGIVIRPKTDEGKKLLAYDCGVPDIPLLEGSLRSLSVITK